VLMSEPTNRSSLSALKVPISGDLGEGFSVLRKQGLALVHGLHAGLHTDQWAASLAEQTRLIEQASVQVGLRGCAYLFNLVAVWAGRQSAGMALPADRLTLMDWADRFVSLAFGQLTAEQTDELLRLPQTLLGFTLLPASFQAMILQRLRDDAQASASFALLAFKSTVQASNQSATAAALPIIDQAPADEFELLAQAFEQISEESSPALLALTLAAPLQATAKWQMILANLQHRCESIAQAGQHLGLSALSEALAQVHRHLVQLHTSKQGHTQTRRDALLVLFDAWAVYFRHPQPESARVALESLCDAAWLEPMSESVNERLLQSLANFQLTAKRAREAVSNEFDPAHLSLALTSDLDYRVLSQLQAELPEVAEQLSEAVHAFALGESTSLDAALRHAHTLKGTAQMAGIEGLSNLSHHVEDILSSLAQDHQPRATGLDSFLIQACDCLQDMVQAIQSSADGSQNSAAKLTPSMQAVYRQAIDWVNQLHGAVPARNEVVNAQKQAQKKLALDQTATRSRSAVDVRVPVKHLEHLVQLVTQTSALLARAHSQIDRVPIEHLQRANLNQIFSALDRLQSEAAATVWQSRLQPFSDLEPRLQRCVRQAASLAGKSVNLTIEGAARLATEQLTCLAEPLMHLLRNAVDHGVESKSVRVGLGKPVDGKLIVRLKTEPGLLQITCEDDGAGLDFELIRSKAIARGLMSPDQPKDSDELSAFIFNAGFSTREQVTPLSGRGIGLDVVATQLRNMNGETAVNSTRGQGTRFQLTVPLNAWIDSGLIIYCADHCLALMTQGIEKILPLDELTEPVLATVESLLDLEPDEETSVERVGLLVRDRQGRVGVLSSPKPSQAKSLLVQAFNPSVKQGEQQPLSVVMAPLAGVTGLTAVGDGVVASVCDLTHLLGIALGRSPGPDLQTLSQRA
jgi:chemotaxis protein histidine kinase CheA